jgi:hypothetical protein
MLYYNQCGREERNATKGQAAQSGLVRSRVLVRPAKGSHTMWIHPAFPGISVTVSGKDGDDAKPDQRCPKHPEAFGREKIIWKRNIIRCSSNGAKKIRRTSSLTVPELPGCKTHGDTYEEAVKNAQEVIELWLETARDLGWSIPAPQELASA